MHIVVMFDYRSCICSSSNAGTDLMCCEFAADGRVVAAGTSDGLIKASSVYKLTYIH